MKHSLRQERKLHDRIMANISARGGIRLPIEPHRLPSVRPGRVLHAGTRCRGCGPHQLSKARRSERRLLPRRRLTSALLRSERTSGRCCPRTRGFVTSTTTAAPVSSPWTPSPMRLLTPVDGEADTNWCPRDWSLTASLRPIRPVPPMITTFISGGSKE